MKSIEFKYYGSPDGLRLMQFNPIAGDDERLIGRFDGFEVNL